MTATASAPRERGQKLVHGLTSGNRSDRSPGTICSTTAAGTPDSAIHDRARREFITSARSLFRQQACGDKPTLRSMASSQSLKQVTEQSPNEPHGFIIAVEEVPDSLLILSPFTEAQCNRHLG